MTNKMNTPVQKHLPLLLKFFTLFIILGGFLGFSTSAQAVNCNIATAAQINTITPVRTLAASAEHVYKVTTPPSDGLLSAFILGDLPAYLRIYDKDCVPVNNAGSSYRSVSQPVLQGVNFIQVVGNGSSVTGIYKLQIDGDFLTDDHGVSFTNASVVRSFMEQGSLTPYGDVDFFQVNVGKGKHLIANLVGGLPAYLRVYDKDFIAASNPSYQSVDVLLTKPGIYFVSVYGNGASVKGGYKLNFSGDIVLPVGTCNGKPATISGTAAGETITGTAGKDVIQGFGGNDLITGLVGDDTICGGDGDDMIKGGDGVDQLLGEAGDDMLDGGTMNDSLNGGLGSNDMCNGGLQTDTQTACEVKTLIP